MPIRPDRMALYPGGSTRSPQWLFIRATKLFDAGNHCEGSPLYPDCRAANGSPHPVTGSRIVLTIAHIDHDERNSDWANLRAWCQRCHIAYDAPRKAAEAKARNAAARAASSPDMFTDR